MGEGANEQLHVLASDQQGHSKLFANGWCLLGVATLDDTHNKRDDSGNRPEDEGARHFCFYVSIVGGQLKQEK